MLMNRPIKRGCMEVYNDYNSNLTNLFFCVKERPLALITELGFLPLNSRDDFEAIYRQLKCEEFDDEYLAIELELADKYFSPLHAKAIKALLLKRAQRGNVRRAANYYKLIRYSFSGAGKSFGGKPCNIRNFFADIWRCSRRLENVVIENKDFESLLAQYDRPDAFFYCDPPYYNAECYEVEFPKRDHLRLCSAIKRCRGFAMVSCDGLLRWSLTITVTKSWTSTKTSTYSAPNARTQCPRPRAASMKKSLSQTLILCSAPRSSQYSQGTRIWVWSLYTSRSCLVV